MHPSIIRDADSKGLSSLVWRIRHPCFPQRILDLDWSDHRAVFYFQSILNEFWVREDSSVFETCSHMASSLHDRTLTCMRGCSETVISGSVPDHVCQCCLRAWRPRTSNTGLALSLAYRDSSRFFESFWWCHVLEMMRYSKSLQI